MTFSHLLKPNHWKNASLKVRGISTSRKLTKSSSSASISFWTMVKCELRNPYSTSISHGEIP